MPSWGYKMAGGSDLIDLHDGSAHEPRVSTMWLRCTSALPALCGLRSLQVVLEAVEGTHAGAMCIVHPCPVCMLPIFGKRVCLSRFTSLL